ncbi:MAG: two-component system, sensor histidine kinase PdtaS, partial [Acidimicrobiaceae bacterium]
MASLAELARLRTDVDGQQLAHLQRLVGTWGLLADFCFADLLLYAPVRGDDESFIILGQIRPATTQTVYRSDWVGTVVTAEERPLVANSFRSGEIVEATVEITGLKEQVRVLAIPVRWNGEVIGVATRES